MSIESQKVWLVHPGGFSAGRLHVMAPSEDGDTEDVEVVRKRLVLDNGGEIEDVDESCIERVS